MVALAYPTFSIPARNVFRAQPMDVCVSFASSRATFIRPFFFFFFQMIDKMQKRYSNPN